MTNSQYKKHQAYLFNMERAERLAYEMDKVLFPAPITTHEGRMEVRASRINKASLISAIALSTVL